MSVDFGEYFSSTDTMYNIIVERDCYWPDPGFEFAAGLLENDELIQLEKKLTNEFKIEVLKKERVHRTIIAMKGFIND